MGALDVLAVARLQQGESRVRELLHLRDGAAEGGGAEERQSKDTGGRGGMA